MVVKDVNKKDINTVLLRFYRKEKYCANLQLNVFYNMSIMGNNINNLADSTKIRLSNILTKQKQIANVKHLLYGKIYDLYDEAMAAINNYNDAVARKDYLVNRKGELDNLIHQQEQRRDSELNTYNTYVNTYIPNKQTEISNKQAEISNKQTEVAAKQQQLDITQAELDNLNRFLNTWDSFTFRMKGYLNSLHSLDYDRTGANYEQAYYTSTSGLRLDLELDMPTSIADFFDTNSIWPVYNMTRDMWVSGTLKYLKHYESILGGRYQYGVKVYYNGTDYTFVSGLTSSNTTVNSAILGEYMSVYNNMKITLNNNRPSNEGLIALRDQYAAELATLQSELATLQSELATLQAQLTQLEAERDYHWNEYQDALNQIASLRKEKELINDQISVVEKSIDDIYKPNAERKSTIYNDAVERLPEKDREEYQDLPEPWNECHTMPDDDDE